MRIYLAARYSRNAEMRGVRDVLCALGHEVTSRWIDQHGGDLPESIVAAELNTEPDEGAKYARVDVDDLQAADVVMSFTSADGGGKGGRHVEFGLALGLGKRVVICGPRENVFHTLPGVGVVPGLAAPGDGVVAAGCMRRPAMPENRDPITPADLFGGNSDGGMRMSEWLDAMCRGCVHESARERRAGNGGGYGCALVARAISDPYEADMPEWSPDARPLPAHAAGELDADQPWPVCMAYQPRKRRSDAGVRRGPRTTGMDPLFDVAGRPARTLVGRVYGERGRPVVILAEWRRPAPRGVPRNVLVLRADDTLVVRPLRGLRRIEAW